MQWLDGNLQVNKVVNIATTNYLEELEQRIRARPRRFDRVLEIDQPDARLRSAYFKRKLPDLSKIERRRWVNVSDGLSFAALAELIISVRCLDHDLEDTAQLLARLDGEDSLSEAAEHDGSRKGDRNGCCRQDKCVDAIPF